MRNEDGEHTHGVQGGSYASVVDEHVGGRKKLNILDIMLERKDNKVNFNLSKEELGKLLFKKMKLDPKSKCDTSGFGKILVEFNNNVNPEDLVTLPAFDIRDGLRTKYYKPHHRKETPDELLLYVFSHFGNVKSNVKWMTIKEETGESDIAKLLNNIRNGERQFWMEVTTPIPSYAMIDKRRIKIHHPGQRRTCARCHKVAERCEGNSNAKLCEDNGSAKIHVATAWKETLASVGYREWNRGEPEVDVDVIEEGNNDSDDENDADISNCDGFVISNLEENATIECLISPGHQLLR